jgi:cation-transporting ATPase E
MNQEGPGSEDDALTGALAGMVAGLIGMIPEELMLLTGMAFAVSAINLARCRVLMRGLPVAEGLVRVNVICLDKT